MNLRLLTYNIRRGGKGRETPLARVIRTCAPDLVVFQEATLPEVVERLAAECGMAQWAARPRTSLGFMSREPVVEHAWYQPAGSRHAFLEIVLADRRTRIFGVHLAAVHSAWTERRRGRELRALLAAIARHQEGPHALVGDFNTLAPGELLDVRKLPYRLRTLVWLSGGRIQWQTVKAILAAGYVDGFRLRHPDETGVTFPTRAPHIRLDYVFVPQPLGSRLTSCEVMTGAGAETASDHFPLFAEFGDAPIPPDPSSAILK